MDKPKKEKRLFRLILKWILSMVFLVILGMFLIPIVFNDFISQEVKKGINKNLVTEFHFESSEISFFNHFPSLTFSFEEVSLAGSEPFSNKPVVIAKEVGFGINIFKLLFSKELEVNETYLADCTIEILKDKFGRNNFNVLHESDSLLVEKKSDTTDFNLNLNKLNISKANIIYKDEAIGITILSSGFNYDGEGGFETGTLELGSQLEIDSIDVVFENVDYLKGKKLRAKSFTIYDANTLSIELDQNNIFLNDLNINFDGHLNVFEEGLAYDLNFNTKNGNIRKLMSALPPKYAEWSKDLKLKGKFDAAFFLAGYSGMVPDSLEKAKNTIELDIYNGKIAHKEADELIEDLVVKFKGSFERDWVDLRLDSLNFRLNEDLTTGQFVASGRSDSLYINSQMISKLDLNLLNQTLKIPGLELKGKLLSDWNVSGIYQPSASRFPKSKGHILVSKGSIKTSGYPEPIKNIELNATLESEDQTYASSALKVNNLKFSFLGNPFNAQAYFKDFDAPEYQINCLGTIDFESLNQVIDLPFYLADGLIEADLNLKGKLANPNSESSENTVETLNTGMLNLKNIKLTSANLQRPIFIKEGQFLFLNEKMAFSKLEIQHGNTQANMDGYFQNYLEYLLFSKGVLRGDIKLNSPFVNVTEFFPTKEQLTDLKQQKSDSISSASEVKEVVNGVMLIPERLDLSFQVEVDTLKYNALTISALSGVLGIKDEGLFLKNGDLDMVDGTAHLEGFYRPIDSQNALFSMDIIAKNLDIKQGYETIELFKELVPAAEWASGNVSVNYSLLGSLDQQMRPVLPSLEGSGTLIAQNIQFEDYKLLGTLSKKSGFDALNNPAVSEITINSTIENNILELERFKFKVRPFRLRAEGQTTLDGELSLKMRLGLPPFGIIGIPIVVKGPSSNFDIKLGRKAPDLEELEGDEEYSEDDIRRMSMLKDSIREGMTIDQIDKMQQKIERINLDSISRTTTVDTIRIQTIDTLRGQ